MKIGRSSLKQSAKCVEEGENLTTKMHLNFTFDPQNGSRMWKSLNIDQNAIIGYIYAMIRLPLVMIGIEKEMCYEGQEMKDMIKNK